MLFHNASVQTEARILTAVGLAVTVLMGIVAAVFTIAPLSRESKDTLRVVLESPYVGEGVDSGTSVMMHGVKVGEVLSVANLPDGGVRLLADLDRAPTQGLTDAVEFDFRPANYFGVTGINLRQPAGGSALVDGAVLRRAPVGNATLQALLGRLGEVSHGVLTPQLIDVVERATTYTDGLDPLLETMLVVADTFARVQTESTATLLTNATGISVAFPGFVTAAISTGDQYLHGGLDGVSEDFFRNTYVPTIDFSASELFGAVGKLVSSHSTELSPLTSMIKVLTDIGPGLVPSDAVSDTAREYRMRLENLFAGPPDRRAVNVRVILDSLPGVAAPLQAAGGLPPIAPAPIPAPVPVPVPAPVPLPAEGPLTPEGGVPQ